MFILVWLPHCSDRSGIEGILMKQTTFDDLVQIPPHGFVNNQITQQDLEDRLNEKYSNKIVQKVGLCICVYDLLKASDGLIGHGTGNANVNVQFRMIVFRPFKGEIITGVIQKCTPEGIRITTRFFDDIFVPPTMLFEGCVYNDTEKTWVWETEGDPIYLDEGTIVNVRVEAEKWNDQAPTPPKIRKPGDPEPDPVVEHRVPYSIEASMGEPGLGGVDWW